MEKHKENPNTENIKSKFSFEELKKFLKNAVTHTIQYPGKFKDETQLHLFLCLAQEIQELKEEVKKLKEKKPDFKIDGGALAKTIEEMIKRESRK